MNNRTENIEKYQELENLLKSKSFDDLNSNEKIFVENFITREEYARMQTILKTSGDIFSYDTLKSENPEKEKLIGVFESKRAKNKRSAKVVLGNFAWPLYKVAIASVILLGSFFFMGWKVSIEMQNQAVIYLTDTIYKEVLVPERIWLADSSTRVRFFESAGNDKINSIKQAVNKLEIPAYNIETISEKSNYETAQRVGIAPEINIAHIRRKQQKGKSLHEDSVLSKFIVGVN